MRYLIRNLSVVFGGLFWCVANAQNLPPEKALKAFQTNRVAIEGYDGRACRTGAVVTGDVNLDGYQDAVVQYGCGDYDGDPKHGLGWAVFLNDKTGKLKLVTKDEKFMGLAPVEIKRGVISAVKLSRAQGDTVRFVLEKNKLIRQTAAVASKR